MDDQRKHEIMEVARQKRLLKAQRRKPNVREFEFSTDVELEQVKPPSLWQRIMAGLRGE